MAHGVHDAAHNDDEDDGLDHEKLRAEPVGGVLVAELVESLKSGGLEVLELGLGVGGEGIEILGT